MSRAFVFEHAGTFPIKWLCELVGVSRSSFYGWASRRLSDHDVDDASRANEICDIYVALHVRVAASPRPASQSWPPARPQAGCSTHGRVRAGRRARATQVAARQARHRPRG